MTNEELAVLIGEGHNEAIPILFENVKKLLYRIAYRYAKLHYRRMEECGVTIDDLKQECYFIMLKSVRAYISRNPEQSNCCFISYIPLNYKSHFQKILSINGRGRPSDALNMYCVALDEPICDYSDSVLMEFIPDDTAEEEYRRIENADYCSMVIETAKKNLNRKQWRILEQIYINKQPQKKIADEFGVSVSRVQQLASSALNKLKASKEFREVVEINEYQHIGVKEYIRGGSIEERIAEFKKSRLSRVVSLR